MGGRCGVMEKVPNSNIVESKFELQSHGFVHFQTNSQWKASETR